MFGYRCSRTGSSPTVSFMFCPVPDLRGSLLRHDHPIVDHAADRHRRLYRLHAAEIIFAERPQHTPQQVVVPVELITRGYGARRLPAAGDATAPEIGRAH